MSHWKIKNSVQKEKLKSLGQSFSTFAMNCNIRQGNCIKLSEILKTEEALRNKKSSKSREFQHETMNLKPKTMNTRKESEKSKMKTKQ